jgi:hypothetical protein
MFLLLLLLLLLTLAGKRQRQRHLLGAARSFQALAGAVHSVLLGPLWP